EGERRHDQQGNELQLFEIARPDADDEAEHAEGHRGEHQESYHPDRMLDMKGHEESRRSERDEAEHGRFGSRSTDIADDDLKCRNRGGKKLVDRADEFREIDAE